MSQKIRIGNDIYIRWSLLDEESQPYIMTGRDVSIELDVGTKRVRIKEFEAEGNTLIFTYYGKDQKYTGSYALKFIENDGEKEMVTFDIKDAFALVEHSWLAVDEGETPETVQLEFVTVTSNIMERIGPPGPSGKVGEVTAEVDANVGTPSVDVSTSGPDEQKDIHFAFHNLKGEVGEPGPVGPQGGVIWPTMYVDTDLWLHIVEPEHQLSDRLVFENGWLIVLD